MKLMINFLLLILNYRRLNEARAIVITAGALPRLQAQKIFAALGNSRKKTMPILIMGLTAMLDEKVLKMWSDGAVTGCLKSSEAPPREFYRVASAKTLTRELSGQDIAFWDGAGYYFNLDTTANAMIENVSSKSRRCCSFCATPVANEAGTATTIMRILRLTIPG